MGHRPAPDPTTLPEAIVLAGGLGTRLRSVVAQRPKCLAHVADRPFIAYLLCQLRRSGIHNVVLATGYRADQVRDYVRDGAAWDLRVRYSVEQSPLGTGGAVGAAARFAEGEEILVLNGDTFLDVSVTALVERHRHTGAVATIALARVAEARRYGTVDLDTHGRVVAFCEKQIVTGPAWISGGVYVFGREALRAIPPDAPSSLEYDLLPRLVPRGVAAFPTEGYFVDIGTPDSLQRAQSELPERFPC